MPANSPIRLPMTNENALAPTAIATSARGAARTREKMSSPALSVPNQWIGWCGVPRTTCMSRDGTSARAGGGCMISSLGRPTSKGTIHGPTTISSSDTATTAPPR